MSPYSWLSVWQNRAKVIILDADLGLANVDVLLGKRPKRNLGHVLAGACELKDAIV